MLSPFSRFLVICLLCVAVACGGSPSSPSSSGSSGSGGASSGNTGGSSSTATVSWSFNGSTWTSTGAPPSCPSPLLQAPTDLSRVTSILYPGQTRGGNYKPHGGFRFDAPGQSNSVAVTAAMDATVYRGVRYIESDETQYLFDFINSCGVMMRLDHLLDLSPKFAAIAAALPAATASSATTTITGQSVTAGESIATAVGFRGTSNVGFDFGVYDLRQHNATSLTGELAAYGVCWLDLMSSANNALVRGLPPGDQTAGRTSDYCH